MHVHVHVTQGGASVGIELRLISLHIELADHPMLAGDYWTAPVRESIHQLDDIGIIEIGAFLLGASVFLDGGGDGGDFTR